MKLRILEGILRSLLSIRYCVRAKGLHNCVRKGAGGILFLPNHPAFIDPVILYSLLLSRFFPRAFADEKHFQGGFLEGLARRLRLMLIPDPGVIGKEGQGRIREKLRECVASLKSGDNILFYPSGNLYSCCSENLGGNAGLKSILDLYPDVQIVLVRTRGLWGSDFSQAKGYKGSFGEILLRHLHQVFLNFLFFMPKRRIDVEFVNCPEDFPRNGRREEINRWLEKFYNGYETPNIYVPYYWYEHGGARYLPEPAGCSAIEDISNVPDEVKQAVIDKLHEYTDKKEIPATDLLGRDLGLDSLVVAELNEWLQQRFGVQVNSPESLKRVSSLFAAAVGEAGTVTPLNPVPPRWFVAEDRSPLQVEPGDNLVQCFLRLAARQPEWPVIADQNTGVMTNRRVILAILALKKEIEAIPGDHIGLMMPACCMGSVLYLTILCAGKVPVMINWTVGPRNMQHCLQITGVHTILTARMVLERLKGTGANFSGVEEKMVFLEDIGASIGLFRKLSAKLQSLFWWGSLRHARIPETAAVLFTSGSESLPKAVPLHHRRVLENLRYSVERAGMCRDDCAIGILPPFHSLGLFINIMVPFATNFRLAYYANPLDGQMIARMTAAYKGTMIVGTPTFVANILRHATAEQMKSMRLFLVGAEKCPESIFALMNQICPECNVAEGYGITECGPIVSFSQPARKSGGDVGQVLGCHEMAVVDEGMTRRAVPGEMGQLLLRGDSIFTGYIQFSGEDPFVEFEDRTWYRTGDFVRLDDQQRIYFCGRQKRFVKLGGEMVSLPAIEEVLTESYPSPENQTGPVLAVDVTGDEYHPVVTVFSTIPVEIAELNHSLRNAGMGPIYSVHKVIQVESIPILGSGKTDYRNLKSLIPDG